MLLQQQEDIEGEEIEAHELVETLIAIIIIVVQIAIPPILGHLEWEVDIIEIVFLVG